ncbi:MAG: tetratricopeptide repeat protein [Pseudomonadota bacterium]
MKRSIATLAVIALPSLALAAPTTMSPRASMDAASATALSQSVRLIEADRYCEALPLLEELALSAPENADVFNLLGYVHRKMDDLDLSAKHYARALSLDPNHLATLAYQGQLFLRLGDLDSAMANLSRLKTLCGSCEEHAELAAAVRASRSP